MKEGPVFLLPGIWERVMEARGTANDGGGGDLGAKEGSVFLSPRT